MIGVLMRNLREVLEPDRDIEPVTLADVLLGWFLMLCGFATLFLMTLGWMGVSN